MKKIRFGDLVTKIKFKIAKMGYNRRLFLVYMASIVAFRLSVRLATFMENLVCKDVVPEKNRRYTKTRINFHLAMEALPEWLLCSMINNGKFSKQVEAAVSNKKNRPDPKESLTDSAGMFDMNRATELSKTWSRGTTH